MTIGYGRAIALGMALGSLAACGRYDDSPMEAGITSAGLGGGGGASGCYGASGTGGSAGCGGPGSRYVTHVVSGCFGPGSGFGLDAFPHVAFGPPKGGGSSTGSLDVVSLGNGGTITVAFDSAIIDGPGVDFIVFENAFEVGGEPTDPYAELATVEVSSDGVTWTAFPCTANEYPYGACAGWHPVLGDEGTGIDPLDPEVAGGDQYDLAAIGVAIARFVRITDRADMPGSFDLDAVGIVNAQCP